MQVRHKNTYMMKRVELEVDTGRKWNGAKLVITCKKPETAKRNHPNETTETSETIETTKTKRLKPSHQTEKKKAVDDNKNIAIRFVSIVVYSWSNSRENRSLDCHDVVVCFGRYGRFVFQITVVSFRWLRSFRFPNYGGFVSVVTVVSFSKLRWFRFGGFACFVSVVSLVSFRWFSFAVSGFSTCCLARLHFTSELNSYLYWT